MTASVSLSGPRSRRLLPVAAVALAALLAGGAAVAAGAWGRRAVREAVVDGLALRVERAVWLDHALDGPAPGTHPHLPGMPDPGFHRLSVSFVVENRTRAERHFRWQSLALRWPRQAAFAASHDGRAAVAVPPGHAASLEAWFDVPDTDDVVTLEWQAGPAPARLLTSSTPAHARQRRGPRVSWPALAEELPPGRTDRGARLYAEKCASCHGDPAVPGSNGAAPHLAGIAAAAAGRVHGTTAAQYVYESMIDPGAYVAETCAGRPGCEEPPPMPSYGETLTPAEAADLVAYLLGRGAPR